MTKKIGMVRIFTDGACSGNPGPGGYGIIILESEEVITLGGYSIVTSNNRMELRGVVECLKMAKEKKYPEIEIHTDSSYVFNAVTKNWCGNWIKNGWKTANGDDVKNKDLWIELCDLLSKTKMKVGFAKVKGHSGNCFNELADKEAKRQVMLAKEGAKDDNEDW